DVDDVGHPRGPRDQTGPPVDVGVPDLARLLVTIIVRSDELASQAFLEAFYGGCTERGLGAGEGRQSQIAHGWPPRLSLLFRRIDHTRRGPLGAARSTLSTQHDAPVWAARPDLIPSGR